MSSAQSCLDPRPSALGRGIAQRPATGVPRRLVFFDNGKMSPPYMGWIPMVEPLLAGLQSLGTVTREGADLLQEPVSEHAPRIERWLKAGVDGVVLGLCDAGVGLPTLLLAAAAERAGIPTVVISIDQVLDLLAAAAAFQAPGLPLVMLPGGRLDEAGQLAESARAIVPEITRGLTADAPALLGEFKQRFPYVKALVKGEGDTPPAEHAEQDYARFAEERHLSDGLPVVAPTRGRVSQLIDRVQRDPQEVVVPSLSPSGAPVTVEQAAICAVMAGARAADFPFVLAGLELMAQPEYRLHIGAISTHPGGYLLLFSGAAADEAGIASGLGCLGPGHRANMVIGRAVSLTLQNVGRAVPGLATLCRMGSPAQLSCCFADCDDGGLPRLNATLGNAQGTVAWGFKCESPRNVMDRLSSTPESLLGTFCSVATSLGSNNTYQGGDMLLIINPEHAGLLVDAGWGREEVRRFVWEHARINRADVRGRGQKPEWPAEWDSLERVPVVSSPESIWIAVAGAPGAQSQVAIPWMGRACWTVVKA